MAITSAQCRAGRALLNWTQDTLAVNARVSRPTIKDFENSNRRPLANNVTAIEQCMYAAGVEFIPEGGSAGDGVRFRERKLQYISHAREVEGGMEIQMAYADYDFLCTVAIDVLEKHAQCTLVTDLEKRRAASEILHFIIVAAESECERNFIDNELRLGGELHLSIESFPPEIFIIAEAH